MSALANSAARGGLSTVSVQGLRVLVGLAATAILGRILSPDDFGLVAMVLAITGVAEIVRDFGVFNAATQARRLDRALQNNLFWLTFLIGLALTIAIACASPLIAALYGTPALQLLVLSLAPIYLLNALSTIPRVLLARRLQFGRLNATDLAPQVLGAGVAIAVALDSPGVTALVAQQLTVAATTLVMGLAFARWLPGLPSLSSGFGGLVGMGAALTAQQGLNYLVRNIDSVIIGRVAGPTSLGFYDRAYQLALVPLAQLNAPLTRVAVPVLAKAKQTENSFARYLYASQSVAAFVTVPLLAALAALAPPTVELLLGDQWTESAGLLTILCIGGMFRSLMQATYWAYVSTGNARRMLMFDLVALPALAGIVCLGILWGTMGVAVSGAVGYSLYWVFGALYMGRVLHLDSRPLLATGLLALCGSAIPVYASASLALLIDAHPVTQLLAGVVLAALGGGLVALSLRPLRTRYVNLLLYARRALRSK